LISGEDFPQIFYELLKKLNRQIKDNPFFRSQTFAFEIACSALSICDPNKSVVITEAGVSLAKQAFEKLFSEIT
jgi:hypothetical protein